MNARHALVNNTVTHIKLILELIFISLFMYSFFPLNDGYGLIFNICLPTLLIYVVFNILIYWLNKSGIKNLLDMTVIFFVMFNIAQTSNGMFLFGNQHPLISKIVYFVLTLFIFIYNFEKRRYIETGLVLFIVYSFRIFDKNLAPSEFIFLHALSIVLALCWLEEVFTNKGFLLKMNPIFTAVFIFIPIVIFSTINAVCPYNSFSQTTVMMNFIFIAFLLANYIRNIKQINVIVLALFFIGVILSILAMQEIMANFLKMGINSGVTRIFINRQSAFIIHPNSIAGFFIALLCIVIGIARFNEKKFFKICAIVFIVIMSFILLLTYSRLGIFSFIVAITILAILRYGETVRFIRKNIVSIILTTTMVVTVILLSPIKQNIISRVSNIYSSRQTFYSCWNSLRAVRDRPLFGFGMDNYYILSKYAKDRIIMPISSSMFATRNVIAGASHSLYVGMAFCLGIIGLLVFAGILSGVILYFIKLNRHILHDNYEKGLLQGIFTAFVAVIIHGIFAMTFHITILPAFFWVFIGLMASIGNIVNFNKAVVIKSKPMLFYLVAPIIVLFAVYAVINPFISEKRYNFALDSFKSGKVDDAIRYIEQAKRYMPFDPKLYELEAEIENSRGLIDKAIGSYKEALRLKKDMVFYRARIGQLYVQKKFYASAIVEFEKAIALDKYGVLYQEHYTDLGNLYEKIGEKEAAIAQFKEAILINPELARNVDWKGFVYLGEILKKLRQDYLIFRDREPLKAEQILYCVNYNANR